jgi:hypothetical protein
MVGANVSSYTEVIYPPRANAAATTTWDFLNTPTA